jgi:hypothetical protein
VSADTELGELDAVQAARALGLSANAFAVIADELPCAERDGRRVIARTELERWRRFRREYFGGSGGE